MDLRRAGDAIRLSISDTGSGFEPATACRKGWLGLISMEERVRRRGGSFILSSEPGNGTALTIDLPVAVARR